MNTLSSTDKKIELLAPAGNFEKLEIAVHYGADAVYLADRRFSLRNFAENFSIDDMKKARDFTRQHGLKMYVACNIFSRTSEAVALSAYFKELGQINPDGIIIADPGVFLLASQTIPEIPVHLSTQANTTSLQAVCFWEKQGVKRINLARELSLAEIKEITSQCDIETEAFVHGAVCISYSGRCLLSAALSGRNSNRGECSHPCRWRYHVCEEKRPGLYLPLAEDERGAYIFNARDICMIEHLDKMIATGLCALKIEGRMKSIHYLAVTVKTYREAIDTYYTDPENYVAQDYWLADLADVTARGYGTNFYLGEPDTAALNPEETNIGKKRIFAAKVLKNTGPGRARVLVKNKICLNDRVDILTPTGPAKKQTIRAIFDEAGRSADLAQPNSVVSLQLDGDCQANDLIRKII